MGLITTGVLRSVLKCGGRPCEPARVFRQNVEQNVAVDEDRHQRLRVSAMISSVVMATSPRPRRWATNLAPLASLRFTALGIIRTDFPSRTNVTSVCGSRPALVRISAGIVT